MTEQKPANQPQADAEETTQPSTPPETTVGAATDNFSPTLPDPDTGDLSDVTFEQPADAEPASDWTPQTVYLITDTDSDVLGDVHNEFSDLFFMRLRLQNPDLQDKQTYMKRMLQQAALEVGMEQPAKVVKRAFRINDELTETDSFKPVTVYLQEDVHNEFSDLWFMRLKLKFPDLQQDIELHRVIQQAVVEVAMESPDRVVERAREIRTRVSDGTESREE